MAIAPSKENILYVIADLSESELANHALWKYSYASGDGSGSGGTWIDLSANMPAYGGAFVDFDSQYGYDLVIEIKPDDDNTVYIGGTNLYMSTNGFEDTTATS